MTKFRFFPRESVVALILLASFLGGDISAFANGHKKSDGGDIEAICFIIACLGGSVLGFVEGAVAADVLCSDRPVVVTHSYNVGLTPYWHHHRYHTRNHERRSGGSDPCTEGCIVGECAGFTTACLICLLPRAAVACHDCCCPPPPPSVAPPVSSMDPVVPAPIVSSVPVPAVVLSPPPVMFVPSAPVQMPAPTVPLVQTNSGYVLPQPTLVYDVSPPAYPGSPGPTAAPPASWGEDPFKGEYDSKESFQDL